MQHSTALHKGTSKAFSDTKSKCCLCTGNKRERMQHPASCSERRLGKTNSRAAVQKLQIRKQGTTTRS